MRFFVDGLATPGPFDSMPPEARVGMMQNAGFFRMMSRSTDPYPEITAQFRSLRMPVLIITGEKTIEIHRRIDEELSRYIPRARSATIPAAGHGSPRENPRVFTEVVENLSGDQRQMRRHHAARLLVPWRHPTQHHQAHADGDTGAGAGERQAGADALKSLEQLRDEVRVDPVRMHLPAAARTVRRRPPATKTFVASSRVPAAAYLDLSVRRTRLPMTRGNVVFYSLRRVIELLAQANPNILELLFMPDDCVRQQFARRCSADRSTGSCSSRASAPTLTPAMRCRRSRRRAVRTSGSTIPRPEAAPTKEEFCHIIPWDPGRQPDDIRCGPCP